MVGEGLQKSDERRFLFYGEVEAQRFTVGIPFFTRQTELDMLVNTSIVVLGDFREGIKTSVMHVRGGQFDVP